MLTNSTVMWSRPRGNGNSILTVYDSYYDCAYDAYITSQSIELPDLFDGLGRLNIPANSFCAVRAFNHVTWGDPGAKNDGAEERRTKVYSELEISGSGNLLVTNGVSGRYFEVIMQSSRNTCTGRLKVDSPEGDDAKLYFADGANWAGTVVAGNVSLTNLTGGAAAANVDFGTLDLAGDFQIRVWTDNDGSIVTNDMLNVGTYVNNGGRLAPISAADGEAFAPAGRIVVGKINKDSPSLPTAIRGWSVKTLDVLGDDANYLLTLKPSSGLQIILR